MFPQRLKRHVSNVSSVQRDPSARHIVVARQEFHQRRLAGTAWADEGHGRPGANRQIKPLEHRRSTFVLKTHLLKHEIPPRAFHRPSTRPLLDFRKGVEDFEDAIHRREAVGENEVQFRQALDGLVQHPEIGVESHERTDRQTRGPHFSGSHPEHENGSNGREKSSGAKRNGLQLHAAHHGVEVFFTLRFEFVGDGFFFGEGLNR